MYNHYISKCDNIGCPPVRGDNPRALASGLSCLQVDKQCIFERKIVNIFLSFNVNVCFVCSKEPSQKTVLLSTHNICLIEKDEN